MSTALSREAKRLLDEEMTHYLYRCYDAHDRLLYIGCTQDVVGRLAVHRSSWHNPASAYLNLHMARHKVSEPIKGRRAARAAEKAAIEAEAPLLNLHHNQGRGLIRVPATAPSAEQLAQANAALTDLIGERWSA